MSDHIFPLGLFSSKLFSRITECWCDVYKEHGATEATLGFIDLVMEMLKQSCRQDESFDVEFDGDVSSLAQRNMKLMIERVVSQRVPCICNTFDQKLLKRYDNILFGLITIFVEHSPDAYWMDTVAEFLSILACKEKTELLVTKTIIYFFTEVVYLRNESNLDAEFKDELKKVRKTLLNTILNEQCDNLVAVNTFFHRVEEKTALPRLESDGCVKIIRRFLVSDFADISSKTLKCIGGFRNNQNLLQLCSQQPVVDALTSLMFMKTANIPYLALEVAVFIQSHVRNARVFKDEAFSHCVLSDDEALRGVCRVLCMMTFRRPNVNTAPPFEMLLQAVRFHKKFRNNLTKCPNRLIITFFEEFTNWPALFEAIDIRLFNEGIINEIFYLIRVLIKRIKRNENGELDVDNLLRGYLHTPIQYLKNLDRRHTNTYGKIISTIAAADKKLDLLTQDDCNTLADIVQSVCETMNFEAYYTGVDTVLVLKQLIVKGSIENGFCQLQIDRWFKVQEIFQQSFFAGQNLDLKNDVLQIMMKISAFDSNALIDEKAAEICKLCYTVVMAGSMVDLSQNRTFLEFNVLALVETYIIEFKKTNGVQPKSIAGISAAVISNRLIEILIATYEELDTLCLSAFKALCRLEQMFGILSIGNKIDVLTQNLLKKVSLAEIYYPNNPNVSHVICIGRMLESIHILMFLKRKLNIRKLVVHMYQKFPDYDFAYDLMELCVQVKNFDMLNDCIRDALAHFALKKTKEKFIKIITPLIANTDWPHLDNLRDHIRQMGIKTIF